MPGKINPTVPEMVIQIAHQICGNDVAITMAVDEGELDLNVWDATFYKCLFENMQILGAEIPILREHCVEGITANVARCKTEAQESIALSTVVAATFGYPEDVRVAHYRAEKGCDVKQAVIELKLMTPEQANVLVDPLLMAEPKNGPHCGSLQKRTRHPDLSRLAPLTRKRRLKNFSSGGVLAWKATV